MNTAVKQSDKVSQVVRLLKKARSILFISGAGISADSGLPTYRGIGGLYNDKVTDEGIPIEMALAGETLETRPKITWKYLAQIEKNCRRAKYNRGHEVIAQMEKHFERVWVLTQNIDGFHYNAGSKNVIEIHGNMHKLLCKGCGWCASIKDFSQIEIPPVCPECKRIARPDVVFFGEMLNEDKLALLYQELKRGFDIYFSVGTTSVFPYIQQPLLYAKSCGKPVIEINPADTEVSHLADIKFSLGAAEALDMIWRAYSL
ncbi:NAD-dependent protein deacylase [bacterium]|nr:MAG: NAD-dependent protein deacylase [bacterium]